jgi:DNA-binding transcriptional ArsR family regulator
MKSIVQFVDKAAAPSLLPVLRSQQQGEILALLLGDPDLEVSLTEIARRTGAPQPSVHREVERAERAGLVTSRKVGNTRLVRADNGSPYYAGLAEELTRAFGVRAVLAAEFGRSRGSARRTCTGRGRRVTLASGATGRSEISTCWFWGSPTGISCTPRPRRPKNGWAGFR